MFVLYWLPVSFRGCQHSCPYMMHAFTEAWHGIRGCIASCEAEACIVPAVGCNLKNSSTLRWCASWRKVRRGAAENGSVTTAIYLIRVPFRPVTREAAVSRDSYCTCGSSPIVNDVPCPGDRLRYMLKTIGYWSNAWHHSTAVYQMDSAILQPCLTCQAFRSSLFVRCALSITTAYPRKRLYLKICFRQGASEWPMQYECSIGVATTCHSTKTKIAWLPWAFSSTSPNVLCGEDNYVKSDCQYVFWAVPCSGNW